MILADIIVCKFVNYFGGKHMSLSTHIEALNARHQELELQIFEESSRPAPNFTTITNMKKQKLSIKEELLSLGSEKVSATAN